ncbi:group III truncated hemoglobin [Pontibaca methylaminivorans]|uniref:Hemoglobin n=1 Tax=Pontibaca methylaminivorans TaxID=515897 RepID=A0A1R3WJY9_9RHOB|nr:group III truncated hemoglobin [Pontibaca methylaminivorans]SIT78430.1 hemoglobin [Pontibaca methylaminivorans]
MAAQTVKAVHGYSAEKRAQIRESAAEIGIDEPYLSTLVDEFYTRIRADARLGPIFDGEIGDGWDAHLVQMKAFWASVALNAGIYSGQPMPAHLKLVGVGVTPEDFRIWLGLFRATLEDTAPTPQAVDYLMIRAERIARSLQMAMFGRDPAGVPAFG